MFVDKVTVAVNAGDGGNGAVSFRHEKFIDRGGPDGGDGGDGGDVVVQASYNQNTLANFRYQRLIKAQSGTAGLKRRKHGKTGDDEVIQVPVGTVVLDMEGQMLVDLVSEHQQAVVAAGGQGGFGNAHFVSSVRQAPRVAEKGERGQSKELTLELKMIADVGLVGLPNAGKSTLLAAISNARPEIADYPFTTLTPNLGVVDVGEGQSLLLADIPGLIEGASQGKGLGDDFLRHLERTSVLLHLIDAYQDDVVTAYKTIQAELKAYQVDMSKRPQMVALTKVEGLDDEIIDDLKASLAKVAPKSVKIVAISSKSGQGIKEMLFDLAKTVTRRRKAEARNKKEELPVIQLTTDQKWQVDMVDDNFVVTGHRIEKFAAKTDFTSRHAVDRLRDIMKKMGILRELQRKGAEPGQKVRIGGYGSVEY